MAVGSRVNFVKLLLNVRQCVLVSKNIISESMYTCINDKTEITGAPGSD